MKLSSGMYTASEQRKARTKTTLIKFFLSRNIRSLRNTPYQRAICADSRIPLTIIREQILNSLGHHILNKSKREIINWLIIIPTSYHI